MKRALITGVTGQDGSYLADLLLSRGYEVHGVARPSTTRQVGNLIVACGHEHFHLHDGDMLQPQQIVALIWGLAPTEVYNLAGQSHVTTSFEMPDYTSLINTAAVIALLDGIREMGTDAPRFYQASSSEIFGGLPGTEPQSERTPVHPRSPYAVAKAAAFWAVRNYREAYGLHASNGILFNHESPRRGVTFVTRKIAVAAARISRGLQERLTLGTLTPMRDWGYAPEYVEAMTRMLAQPEPDDYVVATGKAYTVREFVDAAFDAAGLPLTWRGDHGYNADRRLVEVDPALARPAEVMILRGDPTKALLKLDWKAETSARQLAELMVKHELERWR